jgi:predicted nucleic acid-binding protein
MGNLSAHTSGIHSHIVELKNHSGCRESTRGVGRAAKITALPRHHFRHDEVAPADTTVFSSLSLVGHRQVTDAYLLALAQYNKGKLATFDKGVAELIQAHKERSRYVTLVD